MTWVTFFNLVPCSILLRRAPCQILAKSRREWSQPSLLFPHLQQAVLKVIHQEGAEEGEGRLDPYPGEVVEVVDQALCVLFVAMVG